METKQQQPMTETIQQTLRKYWGYDTYLPLQKEAMECVVSGRDSIVVLPTGGGKSLCFQAPAMIMPGLAVVVSPLISLMKDQVDALSEYGVPAARIDSSQANVEQNAVFDKIKQKALKLLYLSPERLLSNGFFSFLKTCELSFFAIDEAHCVSMWGHDFRPEYRQLAVLKKAFPGAAIHGYTATATEQVRRDIGEQLHLDNPEILVGSFDRPNLIYRVERQSDILNQVCDILDRHKGESGIIYRIRRDDVDEMSSALTEMGYKVLPYHAGMESGDRKKNQEAFIEEKVDIIVATVAFGMGIDKSNVRYVIHAGMPKSLEHYQQESGRAGRDSLEAECCLFYSGGDFRVWKYILKDMPPEPKRIAMGKLSDMYDYCTSVSCRHKAIIRYFGQKLGKSNCAACDVCLGNLDSMKDSLLVSQKILSCIKRLDEQFGGEYTSLVLTGSSDKRILSKGHDKLSTYDILSEYPKRLVRDWIEQLVGQGYIVKTSEYNVLNITENGWRVLKGEETPRLLKPAEKPARVAKVAEESWEGVDETLFEELRKLRRDIADKKGVPAYIVFGDAVLRDMARRRPSTREGFLRVNGVGEQKCKEYSGVFLAVIKEYCKVNSVEMDVTPSLKTIASMPRGSRKKVTLSQTKRDAFELFKKGYSVLKAAESIDRAPSTTMQYLVEYIQKEEIDDPSPWVDPETYRNIVEAARQADDGRLKPIFERLNGDVSYELIRVSMACLRNRG